MVKYIFLILIFFLSCAQEEPLEKNSPSQSKASESDVTPFEGGFQPQISFISQSMKQNMNPVENTQPQNPYYNNNEGNGNSVTPSPEATKSTGFTTTQHTTVDPRGSNSVTPAPTPTAVVIPTSSSAIPTATPTPAKVTPFNMLSLTEEKYIDSYEASVWDNPDCSLNGEGKGGKQYGIDDDDYEAVPAGKKLYACSLPNVKPSRLINFYQSKEFCENSKKILCDASTWKKACKGTPEGLSQKCNHSGMNQGGPLKTGAMADCKSSNNSFDMIGNVWEWTTEENGKNRGVRGGAWGHSGNELTCYSVTFQDPSNDKTGVFFGFRCCLVSKEPPVSPGGTDPVPSK